MTEYVTVDDIINEMNIKPKKNASTMVYVKPNIESIDISKVRIKQMVNHKDGFQRLTTSIANSINNDFNPKYFHIPLISRHPDGSLWVVDGANRIVGAKARGITHVDCIVIDTANIIEDAEIFYNINKQRKQLNSPIATNAKAILGDKHSKELIDAINIAGFTFHEKKGHLQFKAATGVMDSAKHYGFDTLTKALLAYKAIWSNHNEVNADVVRGLMFIIWAFINKGQAYKVDAHSFSTNIDGNTFPFSVIPRMVNASGRKYNHKDRDYHFACVIVEEYNVGLKGQQRLSQTVLDKA